MAKRNSWRRGPHEPLDIDRIRAGMRRTEHRHGHDWVVQPIAPERALKEYTCPGCGLVIAPGQAHIVVIQADSVRGDAAAIADRRHWHPHCWRIN